MQAVLDDWRTAPVDERTRATLGLLETLTLRPDELSAADIAPLRAQGITHAAIEDAIHVCALFNIYDRLADSLEFDIPDQNGFAMSATMLLKRGYV